MSRRPLAVAAVVGGAALLATACQVEINTGGEEVTRSFDITAVDHLEVDGAFDVTIEIGDTPSLEIDIDEEVEDRLEVDQDGDRLSIGLGGGLIALSTDIDVRLTTPDLSTFQARGAVDADLEDLDGGQLDLILDGAASVRASGSVGVLVIDADGASDIDFGDVIIDRVEVDADGASSIDVSTADAISGRIRGASSIDVSDTATVDVRTSGAATID